MKKVLCIVQARMGSERLRGKVLKDLKGKPMIYHTLMNLKESRYIDEIILATSDLERDDKLASYVENLGFKVFRGSENNVLERYKKASDKYKGDVIVRVTGDCPLINPIICDNVITKYFMYDYDYVRLDVPNTFQRGFDTEVFSKEALDKVYSIACSKENVQKNEFDKYREHVTYYIYTHKDDFKISVVEGEGKYFNNRDINLSVDTIEDFKRVEKIKNDSVYIYGTGNFAKEIIKLMNENFIEILGVIDRDKTEGEFLGVKIVSLDLVDKKRKIIIGSQYYKDIGDRLKKLGFNNTRYYDLNLIYDYRLRGVEFEYSDINLCNERLVNIYEKFSSGGAETYIKSLCKYLNTTGMDTYIIGGKHGKKFSELDDKYQTINFEDIKQDFEECLTFIRKNKIKIIMTHSDYSMIIAKHIKKYIDIEIVRVFHNKAINKNKEIYIGINNFICISEEVLESFQNLKIEYKNLKLIPNMVSFNNEGIKEKHKKSGVLRLLLITRLDADKRSMITNVIDNILNLNSVNLDICGDGTDKEYLFRYIKEKDIESKVKFLGEQIDVLKFIKKSDVVIGIGRSILESLSLGKPVILVGHEKYVGLVDIGIFKEVAKVNFTDRNFESTGSNNILSDIKKIQVTDKIDVELKRYFIENFTYEMAGHLYRDFIKKISGGM